jgi:hypothetical protein
VDPEHATPNAMLTQMQRNTTCRPFLIAPPWTLAHPSLATSVPKVTAHQADVIRA